ncbi:MAG TPA: hypothetical protein VKT33_12595 [Candidatus Angelobacter sp.]|nr:hypothetical protein [Candidatus Angelobacter sp.]
MTPPSSPFTVGKVIRWCFLAVLIVVLALLLKKPAPVAEPMAMTEVREKAEQFQTRLGGLETSQGQGEHAEARFSAEEVNAAFQQSATEQAAAPSPAAQAKPAAPPQEAPPDIQTVKIAFADDHVTGQFATNVYGKDVYLTISGRLGAKDGYATFEFTEAKIDSLPVPVSILNPQLQEKLQQPENREKLKLPAFVSDLRVENGHLVVVGK